MNGQPDEGERSCCCAMWRRCSQAARGRRGAVSRPLQMGIRRECRPTCSSAFWRPPGIGQRSGKKNRQRNPCSVCRQPAQFSPRATLHEIQSLRFRGPAIGHTPSAISSCFRTRYASRTTRYCLPRYVSPFTAFRSPTNDASRFSRYERRSSAPLGIHEPLLPVKTRVIKRLEKGILRASCSRIIHPELIDAHAGRQSPPENR